MIHSHVVKRKKKVDTTWTPHLAYAIGVIATDGNLSPDGRHICITSKDGDWLSQIRDSLELTCRLGKKARAHSKEKKYSVLQIGDINFYEFLLDIGLTPNKSKSISQLKIHPDFFHDFLRGCIDGDGSITLSSHPESKHQQLRIRLCSASSNFIQWIHKEILTHLDVIGGWVYVSPARSVSTLSYGKADSIKILHYLYSDPKSLRLERKFQTGKAFMGK